MKPFLFATAVLMSTIVGVGMFGLPYVASRSGFLIATFFLVVLTGFMTLLHLFYGEIVGRTREKHRLVGYANHYLGKWGKHLVTISVIVGFYGSLLVYIIVGGDFLNIILSPLIVLPPVVFNLIFFAIGALAVYFGLRLISGLDLFMGLFLILIVFLFLFFGFNHINIDNLKTINWRYIFIPYGVILYSLAGMAAIPEIREIFSENNRKFYKKSIILGTVIPAILYFVFMTIVVGLTGQNTSLEAIAGLTNLLGKRIVLLGATFGFLATITSFFILGLSLKKTFWHDFKIGKNLSWFLACFVPLVLFVLGAYNFITVITLLGALMGGVEGTAIVLIYKKAKKFGNQVPDYDLKEPVILNYIMILVFIFGFIYTLLRITSL
ncbi:MAG: aromatic amino acid transport family protein [Patescibacteria group bacterium]